MLGENFKIVVTIVVRFSKLHVLTTVRLYHVASYSDILPYVCIRGLIGAELVALVNARTGLWER
jgi:hypothetical protein